MAEGERVELYAIFCIRGLTVPRTRTTPATHPTPEHPVYYIRQYHTHVNQKTRDGTEMAEACGIKAKIFSTPGLS